MASDLISLIVRVNVVLAGAIVLVLLLRPAARRCFGARVAYALWAAPVVAALACFLPARVEHVTLALPIATTASSAPAAQDQPLPWLVAWCGGVL